ncbi:MAG: cadmium-translocating P-type ATPase [Syntrophomonadaceae bacterium]|jgi:Cd2+/Zn2+-exporting ATPase|nr:cadmium-translocating P-type ATPase [Syntrophomonadaceae bacterium]
MMEKGLAKKYPYEPNIVLREEEVGVPAEKSIYLVGLNCADCAAKINLAVNDLEGVHSACLDVVSQKLTIKSFDRGRLADLAGQAGEIALSIEPDIKIAYRRADLEPESENSLLERVYKATAILGVAAFLTALIFTFPAAWELGLYLLSYLLIGGKVLLRALKNIVRGQVFDENSLMGAATVGAFAIGEYPEGVAVMLFYRLGEFFQDLAVDRSRRSITELMDIRPDYANLKKGDGLVIVNPEEVAVGDIIVVKPGEKVPLDGKVLEGQSSLDVAALTGESAPRYVMAGDEALSGSVNQNGVLTVKVSKEFGDSTVSKILDLVENVGAKKAPTEQFITKFARYYTPAVVFVALALAVIPPLASGSGDFSGWIHRALVFLVVSCPCALVISIPLGFFGGIGGASKQGILIKGGNYLEALNDVDTVIFDKTGTLTKGIFTVTQIKSEEGFSEKEVLFYAAGVESFSGHPISNSIKNYYARSVDISAISDYEEVFGEGVRATVNGRRVAAGNMKLMRRERIECRKEDDTGDTVVYVAVDGRLAGYILIADKIRPDSQKAVDGLRALGVKSVNMLTGDNNKVSEKVAKELGLDSYYAELLPQNKIDLMEQLKERKKTKGQLLFVGDGINDAPVLACADVGLAMGGLGADAAIEAADVVLMTDEPSQLLTAINIARKTKRVVWQNISLALTVKAVILCLGALGMASMWGAVFGDVGVALLAILNSMRAGRL